MSHENENIDELHFLSLKRKQALNRIVSEMSSFLFLSTFRDMEKKWCDADSTAHRTVKTLFRLKGDRICDLMKTILDGGLLLTETQKKAVLSYLYTQTEKNREAMRPNKCSRNFFQTIFDKCVYEMKPNKNNNNKKRPREASDERDPSKKLKLNAARIEAYKSIATLIPSGIVHLNGPHMEFQSVGISPSCVLMAVPFHPDIATALSHTLYNPTSRHITDAQCISLPPSNTHSATKKEMPQSSEGQPIPVKPCKKDEKEKENKTKSVVDHNTDLKRLIPPTEEKKKTNIPTEEMKQNQNRKPVGTSNDDYDSDIEITGIYMVTTPAVKKYVSSHY